MLTGGCLCGEIRYEADGEPFDVAVCHCVTCRRASGAPMVGWFSVKRAGFRLQGELTAFCSSEEAVRRFCPRCGSPVIFDDERSPEVVDLATATLDDPNPVMPDRHIWARSQLAWVKLDDGLPRFAVSSEGAEPMS